MREKKVLGKTELIPEQGNWKVYKPSGKGSSFFSPSLPLFFFFSLSPCPCLGKKDCAASEAKGRSGRGARLRHPGSNQDPVPALKAAKSRATKAALGMKGRPRTLFRGQSYLSGPCLLLAQGSHGLAAGTGGRGSSDASRQRRRTDSERLRPTLKVRSSAPSPPLSRGGRWSRENDRSGDPYCAREKAKPRGRARSLRASGQRRGGRSKRSAPEESPREFESDRRSLFGLFS